MFGGTPGSDRDCRGLGCLLCLEDLSDALLGLDDGELKDPATFVSAVASATFFRGDVGRSFSTVTGGTSPSATDVRGVNSRDARGVEVLAEAETDFVMVSVEAFRFSIGTMRTVATDPSLGCDACPELAVEVEGLLGSTEVGALASGASAEDVEGLPGSAGAGAGTGAGALPFSFIDGIGGTFGIAGLGPPLALGVPRVDAIETGLPSARVVMGLVTAARFAAGLLAPARARVAETALFAEACEAAEIRR